MAERLLGAPAAGEGAAPPRSCNNIERLSLLKPPYGFDGRLVIAVSGGNYSGEYIAFTLPVAEAATRRNQPGARPLISCRHVVTTSARFSFGTE